MPRRRNTLIKDLTLPSLQIAATIIKIKAEIATKTETDITANRTDDRIAAADLGDVATSVRRKNADHGSIQRMSVRRLRRNTRPDSVIEPKADTTIDLRTDLSNISSNAKVKKKTSMRYLRPLLQISALNLISTNHNLRLPTSPPLETLPLMKPLLLVSS